MLTSSLGCSKRIKVENRRQTMSKDVSPSLVPFSSVGEGKVTCRPKYGATLYLSALTPKDWFSIPFRCTSDLEVEGKLS